MRLNREGRSCARTDPTSKDQMGNDQMGNDRLLGQRFGLGSGFLQNIRRNFPDGDIEFEHGRFRAAAPAVYIPVSANKLHFATAGQVEQQRMLAAVELLR